MIQYANGVMAVNDTSTGAELVQLKPSSKDYGKSKIGFNRKGTEIFAASYCDTNGNEPLLEVLRID